MMTTDNIIRNEIKPQAPLHVPSTDYSTLKKGQRIRVRENPLDPKSREVGQGVLTKCNDVKVYHHANGYENWNVKLDYAEHSEPKIIHARDLVEE